MTSYRITGVDEGEQPWIVKLDRLTFGSRRWKFKKPISVELKEAAPSGWTANCEKLGVTAVGDSVHEALLNFAWAFFMRWAAVTNVAEVDPELLNEEGRKAHVFLKKNAKCWEEEDG